MNRIAEAREFAIGIVAPDGRQGMGAIKIEARGTQNHRFTPEEFEQRFAADFGSLESVILK